MKIYDNGVYHDVRLRTWSNSSNDWEFGGTDSSADVMFDPTALKWSDEVEAYILLDGQSFEEWFGWWNEQCDLYNKRDDRSWFVEGLSFDELEAEWSLDREMILDDDESN